MEYEGEIVLLSNPDVKLKQLMRVANAKDNEIRALKSQIEETKRLLEEAMERISRLLGEKALKGRQKAAAKRPKPKKMRPYKKPDRPKRTFTPEQLLRLRENMRKARQAQTLRYRLKKKAQITVRNVEEI